MSKICGMYYIQSRGFYELAGIAHHARSVGAQKGVHYGMALHDKHQRYNGDTLLLRNQSHKYFCEFEL
jgi:hypothetical protein